MKRRGLSAGLLGVGARETDVSLSALPPTSILLDHHSSHFLLCCCACNQPIVYKQAPFSVALCKMQVETMGKRSASEISSTNGEEEVEAMVRRRQYF